MHPGRALVTVLCAAVLAGSGFALGRATDDAAPRSRTAEPEESIPTPSQESPACGVAPAKPGGGRYICTFADDFDGTSLDRSRWQVLTTARSGFTNGGECYVDKPGNVSVSDGTLHLTLRPTRSTRRCPGLPPEFGAGVPYTAGMVTTSGVFSQAYGRFDFRARFPTLEGPGLHSALWLWPQNHDRYGGRPNAGEIDVAEFFSAYSDRVIPYVHFEAAFPGQPVTNNECLVDDPGAFHTYSLEWSPDAMTIAYDGRLCLRTAWQARGLVPPAPFDVPFFVNLTQGRGIGGNAPTADLPEPATMDVDYVRVWS